MPMRNKNRALHRRLEPPSAWVVDEHGQHAKSSVEFDKSHPAHAGGQIVHLIAALSGGEPGVFLLKTQRQIFCGRRSSIPLPLWFLVHGTDAMSLSQKLVLQDVSR
jgi:hypothetical protein